MAVASPDWAASCSFCNAGTGFVVGTGCEVKGARVRVPAAAQGQCPQSIDSEWFACRVSESTEEIPVGIEGMYLSVAEVADEDLAAEPTKGV